MFFGATLTELVSSLLKNNLKTVIPKESLLFAPQINENERRHSTSGKEEEDIFIYNRKYSSTLVLM